MICEHLDWDNQRDCENEAEYVCICCSSPVCQEHKTRECAYGGMGFIELETETKKLQQEEDK